MLPGNRQFGLSWVDAPFYFQSRAVYSLGWQHWGLDQALNQDASITLIPARAHQWGTGFGDGLTINYRELYRELALHVFPHKKFVARFVLEGAQNDTRSSANA
jgi:hypothetical protein